MILGGDRGIVRLFCFLFPVFLPSQITSCQFPSSACHVLLFLLLLFSFRICVVFCLSCSAFSRWQAITSTSLLRCHCSICPAVGGWIKYFQCGEAEGGWALSDSSAASGARSKRSHLWGAFPSHSHSPFSSFFDGAEGLLAVRPVSRAGYETDVCGLTYGWL